MDIGFCLKMSPTELKKIFCWKKIFKFTILLISLSLMSWQVISCVKKVFDAPTGTTQSFENTNMNTTFSITFCTENVEGGLRLPFSIRIKDFDGKWIIVNQESVIEKVY